MKRLFLAFILSVFLVNTINGHESEEDWLLTFNIPSMGTMKTVFNFRFQDSSFEAFSKGDQAKPILGFWKYGMARIFTDNFQNGSIARITSGRIHRQGNKKFLKGILKTPMGDRYFRGKMEDSHLTAFLLDGNKDTVGQVKGNPFQGTLPLRDYSKLTGSILDTIKAYLYNPTILQSDDWKDFQETLEEVSVALKDDLGLLMAFNYFRGELPFSHLGLTRTSSETENNNEAENGDYVKLTELPNETIKMEIQSFAGSGEEIQKAFRQVKTKSYKQLVIDLRQNSGGGIEAGMAFVKHLMNEPRYGGIFLTRNYFREHDSIPLVDVYTQFPNLEKGDYEVLFKGIHNYKGWCLKVNPVQNPYEGKVYVLTSKFTASTCEPIVYALKQYGRAKIVGEKTAGSMLSAESFQLADHFKVYLPTATYYTADGYKIDQNGVEPHYQVPSKKALKYTKRQLIGIPAEKK